MYTFDKKYTNKIHAIATVALNNLVVFLQTISLARTGCCPAGEDIYSFHVHNEGAGVARDSRRTGLKLKFIKLLTIYIIHARKCLK